MFLGIAAVSGAQAARAAGAAAACRLAVDIGAVQWRLSGRRARITGSASPPAARVRLFTPMLGVLTVLFMLLNLSTSAIEKFSVAALVGAKV